MDKIRVSTNLNEKEAERFEDYRRNLPVIPNRSEAVRDLILRGLDAFEAEKSSKK
jgi:metal-responsive CopG/Arc/MetJ family transcriptional regulator